MSNDIFSEIKSMDKKERRALLEKLSAALTPERAGTLFFRINDAPGNLAKNAGSVKIQIKRAASSGKRGGAAKSVE